MGAEKEVHYQVVGQHIEKVNQVLNVELLTGDIYMYPGFPKHIKKSHKDCLPYIKDIPDIISNPDYVGINPSEPDSVEYIKIYKNNILLSVNLCKDKDENYLYVSSLYDISDAKLNSRIKSGRFKQYI